MYFFFFKDFFSKSESKLHGSIASFSPNEGAYKSILPKCLFKQIFKPVLNVNKLTTTTTYIFKRSKFSKKKKKKNLFGIQKIRRCIFFVQ